MKKTILHEEHLKLGAKMANFAGWDMPISYSSVKNEIISVRNESGVFDVSHMGEFFVEGPESANFINYLIPNNFDVERGKAVYSPLLNKEGKIIDDLIVYKLSTQKVLICVNAANIDKDWAWIKKIHEEKKFECQIENKSNEYSLLAIQGPDAEKHLCEMFSLDVFRELPYYGVEQATLYGGDCILARTGYTGEDGFEIFSNHETIKKLWAGFLGRGVAPCGLAARDTLRLEVCYPLYGHELNESLTPLDCGLKWTVKMDKEDFVGKAALEQSRPSKRLVKLSLEKGIPREGYEILNSSEQTIGVITSGTMSPLFHKGIAMGLVDSDAFPEDKKLSIRIRNNIYEANYHTKPFLTGGHK
ncbi:MAG: glycine cleavage system aminomethyltransferase GcvT [Halobacteriovoraceae bacterium]|nr:glycine cleavage system aminomethyltransferase GcvT [Halobacteriovoraceae bacterium]